MSPRARFEVGAPPLRAAVADWLDGKPAAEVLRDTPRRRVVRLQVGANDVLVKHFRSGSAPWPERAKRWWGRSPAEREWRVLCALEACDVPVPTPLGFARLANGDAVIVTAWCAGAPLRDELEQAAPQVRREALRALGRAVHALHRAGFAHGDLHLGNALAGPAGPVLIDFQRSRRALSSAARLRDLGMLDFSLARNGTLSDRVRALRAAVSPGAERRLSRRLWHNVQAAHRAWATRHYRSRLRHASRPGRSAALVRVGATRGLRLHSLAEADLDEALRGHRAAPQGAAEVLENDARGRVTRVRTRSGFYVVKQASRPGLRPLADAWRGSPARRAWRGGHGLAARGVRAAQPLAYLERRRLGVPLESWIVLEDLTDWLPADAASPQALPAAVLAPALARLLRELHTRQAHHRDLKARNLRVSPRSGEVALLDLEDVSFPVRPLGDRARVRALAQLNASLPDGALDASLRRSAFHRYARALPFQADAERVLRDVVAQSRQRRHHWRGDTCDAN
ncbi:MAG: phosphotransferase [Proteobacteria bacterium]|nr:phosphotransferase [Pseudomonadota bacterium]